MNLCPAIRVLAVGCTVLATMFGCRGRSEPENQPRSELESKAEPDLESELKFSVNGRFVDGTWVVDANVVNYSGRLLFVSFQTELSGLSYSLEGVEYATEDLMQQWHPFPDHYVLLSPVARGAEKFQVNQIATCRFVGSELMKHEARDRSGVAHVTLYLKVATALDRNDVTIEHVTLKTECALSKFLPRIPKAEVD